MTRKSISLLFCFSYIAFPIIYGSGSIGKLPDLGILEPEDFHSTFAPAQALKDDCKLKVNLLDRNRERGHPYKTSEGLQNRLKEYNTDQLNRNYPSKLSYQEYSQSHQLSTMKHEKGIDTNMLDISLNEFVGNDQGNQQGVSLIYGHPPVKPAYNASFEHPLIFGKTINNHTEDYRYRPYDFNQVGTSQWVNFNMLDNINTSHYTTNVDPIAYRNPICDETMVEVIPFTYDSIINHQSNSFNNAKFNEMILDLLLYRLKHNGGVSEGNINEKLRILNTHLTVWDNKTFCEDIVNILEAFNLTLPELDFIKDQANEGPMPLNNLSTAVDRVISTLSSGHLYSSFNFLYILFSNKHNMLTYESIEAALSPAFFHSLSTDQFIDAMECILNNGFNLSFDDVKNVIELFFGYMDCSPNMKLLPNDVCRIIKVILASNNPDSFECVYLTWRMWGVITCKQQVEIMDLIQELPQKLPREVFIMLYLFILNPIDRENENSEGLREWFISKYADVYLDVVKYEKETLRRRCLVKKFSKETMQFFLMSFNGALMYFPDILQDLECCKNIQQYLSQYATGTRFTAKYFLHGLYAFVRHRKPETIDKMKNISSFLAKFCTSAKSFYNRIEELGRQRQHQNGLNNYRMTMSVAICQLRMMMQDREYDMSIFEDSFTNFNMRSNNKMLFLALTFTMISNEFVEENMLRIIEFIKSNEIFDKNSVGSLCIKNLQGHLDGLDKNGLIDYVRFVTHIFYKKKKGIKNENTREEYIYKYLAFNPEINIVREFLGDYLAKITLRNEKTGCRSFFIKGITDLFWCDYYYNAFLSALPEFIQVLSHRKHNGEDKDRLYRLCVEFNNEDKEVRKMIKTIFKNLRKIQN
ncbi:hypothetical protein PAEPH01_0652 [Pancytospora epiphaga]|nr:hypothetical protein PAEPH01_0652 [Pancytospora epiphaga]